MATLCFDVLNQEKINEPNVARILGNFTPSIWGDSFTSFSLDNELWEKYSAKVEEVKEQVRSMLIDKECKSSKKMVLIDTLERLGLAYHFEEEIEAIMEQLFDNFQYNEDYDLYNVALHFRIFRQHGYNMSCDVFNKFKGSDCKLKETLVNDVMGMLSLYEAANLAKHGDDILDEALVFTKTRLQAMIPNLSSDFASQVKRSMNLCFHRSLPRIEARNYIDAYGSDPMRNETLLYFAKIDYNLVQLLHLQELSGITKWWKDIVSKFPYVRDRIVECYFWSVGVYFEPRYSVSRIALTKVVAMILLLDDTFDSYGTLDELKVFKDVVERWDAGAIQQLPDYLKLLYKTLLDLIEEFDQKFTKQRKSYGVSYVKQEAKDIVKSYYLEAEWFKEGRMPSFDDYLVNGLVTGSYLMCSVSSFLGMREAASNKEAFDWLRSRPKASVAVATIWRLLDDIATYELEKARGQVATGIECYMLQYGVSKEDVVNEFKHRVDKAWKDLNGECLKPTPIPKPLLDRLINSARVMEVGYCKGDGFTNPEKTIKDDIISLLVNPVPLV